MLRIAFDVPIPHLADLAPLSDFRVAHAGPVMANIKYREKVKPIDLLLDLPNELPEVKRVVALATPHHITIAIDSAHQDISGLMRNLNVAVECEVALIVPPGALNLYDLAVDEGLSIISFKGRDRIEWVRQLKTYERWQPDHWYHFHELDDAADLKAIIELDLKFASVHTSLPIRMVCEGAVEPETKLDPEQVAKAKELMQAMAAVCLG